MDACCPYVHAKLCHPFLFCFFSSNPDDCDTIDFTIDFHEKTRPAQTSVFKLQSILCVPRDGSFALMSHRASQ